MMAFFRTWLGKILIWKKISKTLESEFKHYLYLRPFSMFSSEQGKLDSNY